MRNATWFVLAGLLGGGCGAGAGQTRRELAGPVKVVFTNASAQPICELQMTFEDTQDFGDNWLPAAGLASGASVEFAVKSGRYRAAWRTCDAPGTPVYAGTLVGAASVTLDAQTQLYAYFPDTVPPTKRAATLGRTFKLVRFVGQPIEQIAPATPQKVDAFAAAEAELESRRAKASR